MEKAARRGDKCTGHDSAESRPAQRGSPDVAVNDRAVLRVGDPFSKHGADAHGGKVAKGSTTVFINDLPAARVGDPIDCGSRIETGSSEVFIGD